MASESVRNQEKAEVQKPNFDDGLPDSEFFVQSEIFPVLVSKRSLHPAEQERILSPDLLPRAFAVGHER